MKILHTTDMPEAIATALSLVESAFIHTSSGEGKDINNFSRLVSDLVIALEDAGYDYLLLKPYKRDSENFDYESITALARKYRPDGKKLITDESEAEAVSTEPKLPKAVQGVQVDIMRDGVPVDVIIVNTIYLAKLQQGVDYREISASDVNWLLKNMALAQEFFLSGDEDNAINVMRTTAKIVQAAGADCVVMPRHDGYDYTDENDPLVRFCRFVGNSPAFGFTVCHGRPIKRKQPIYKERTSFSVPEYETFNLAVAETISERSFTPGHYDRYEEVQNEVEILMETFKQEGDVNQQSLAVLMELSEKWSEKGELSFTRIKLAEDHTDFVEAISKAIHPDYPISFVAAEPKEEA
jgi:hypothetical protein